MQKWTVLEGNGCDSDPGCGWNREQLDVSSKENVYIREGGYLAIVAQMANTNFSKGYHSENDVIGSARLSTFGSADFLHGKVEVRAKVAPGGWGGWSGVWLLPSEGQGLDHLSCARVNVVEVRDENATLRTNSLPGNLELSVKFLCAGYVPHCASCIAHHAKFRCKHWKPGGSRIARNIFCVLLTDVSFDPTQTAYEYSTAAAAHSCVCKL